jgi:hypothetical protein
VEHASGDPLSFGLAAPLILSDFNPRVALIIESADKFVEVNLT